MALYHVCSKKKFGRYLASGGILPPVRAWKTIVAAERFSKQTGRRMIVRLVDNSTFKPLEGHRGEAVISESKYEFVGW